MKELPLDVIDFAENWFERLFVGVLPYDLVLRIMDM